MGEGAGRNGEDKGGGMIKMSENCKLCDKNIQLSAPHLVRYRNYICVECWEWIYMQQRPGISLIKEKMNEV